MSAELSDLGSDSPFICPITGILVGGKNSQFSVLKTCGCVFSEKALKECPSETCLVCTKPFTKDDIFQLNPEEEHVKLIKETFEQKRKEKKTLIKEKQNKEEKGTKRKVEEDSSKSNKRGTVLGSIDVTLAKPKKPTPASAPVHSDKDIYASIFTSSLKNDPLTKKESFLCRNVARG